LLVVIYEENHMTDTITITRKSYIDLVMVSLTALARVDYYAKSDKQIKDYENIEAKMTNALKSILDQVGD